MEFSESIDEVGQLLIKETSWLESSYIGKLEIAICGAAPKYFW